MQQKLLLEDTETDIDLLSYKEASRLLNVSHASITNWIKAGYLEKSVLKGYLKKQSFENFCADVVGNEKLNARANKQHAKAHDHQALCSEISAKIWQKCTDRCHGEKLAQSYEGALSNTHKNKQGVYYTPMEICRDLVKRADVNGTTTFCDPCCGSGNFLIAALEAGVSPENLTGYDIDAVALEIAKRRIFDRTRYKTENLFVADFLSLENHATHDVLMTNPPWGKKYSKQQKQTLSRKFELCQSLDSCSLFAMAILQSVKKNGQIGLLLPASFFNIKAFDEIRNKILQQKIDFLIDFGKAFECLVTNSHAIVLTKAATTLENKVNCILGTHKATHKQATFTKNPFSIINFNISEIEKNVIDAMLANPHTTLEGKARWGLGIVTGNNKKHLVDVSQEGYVPVFKGADIQRGKIKQPQYYIEANFSRYQQVAPLELYQAPNKIIYKFISSDIVFFHDDQQRFILNSANMLVVDEDRLTKTGKLVDYFNLDIINWFHKKLFNTHKILRSNLECVPIYQDYLDSTNRLSNQSLLDYLDLEQINGTYRVKKQAL